MEIDKRLCVPLYNATFRSIVKPLRISMYNTDKSKPKCSIYFNLVNAIVKTLGIPIRIEFGPYLGRLVKGKWDGIIGQLVNNELDVALGAHTATYERFQWTQLSTLLGYSSPLSILSGRISENTIHNDFHVFNTLSLGVWTVIVLSIILIAIVDHHLHKVPSENLVSRIILTYTYMLGQSSRHLKKYCCLKHMLVIGMGLYCFKCLRLYFETFILIDQVEDSYITINSLDDIDNLLCSTTRNISVIANKKFLTWRLLENSKDEIFQKVFNHITNYDTIGFDDIYRGRQIAINNGRYLQSVVNANKHLGFHLGRHQYYESANVIYYSKTIDNRVKQKIDSVIVRVYESGLQDFWWALLFERKIDINETRDDENQTITLQSIGGIFILLPTINLLLIYILIFELVIKIT